MRNSSVKKPRKVVAFLLPLHRTSQVRRIRPLHAATDDATAAYISDKPNPGTERQVAANKSPSPFSLANSEYNR